MTEQVVHLTAQEAAVDWLLRLDAPDASEAEWSQFQAWLEASPDNLDAYERAQRVSAELSSAAAELRAALDARPVAASARRLTAGRRPAARRPGWIMPTAASLTAAAAALVVVVGLRPPPPAPTDTYQTARGESRALALADGSHVQLNSGSRLTVRLDRDARRLELTEGEAAFDVAKDATRPFLIGVGDRTVRVVGTEFDVLRHDGRLRVTVRRGIVAVQTPDAAAESEPVLLKVGDQLDHLAGDRVSTVRHVDPDAAFAWKTGQLIYQDQSLSEVVGDLNRYFAAPIHVDAAAADLKFSGVLKLDREEDVVRRLQGFLQLAVGRDGAGFTLHKASAAR